MAIKPSKIAPSYRHRAALRAVCAPCYLAGVPDQARWGGKWGLGQFCKQTLNH